MAANKKILVLAGDGIGPEVMRQVRRIVDWMAKRRSVNTFNLQRHLVSRAALRGFRAAAHNAWSNATAVT